MNLKEAIERGEEDAARGHCSIRLLSDEWNAILAAAKKQLAIEEAAKPHEVCIEAGYCRKCGFLSPIAHLEDLADWVCLKCHTEAAKPKRASLEELEAHLRLERCDAPWEVVCRKATAAADILKALRKFKKKWGERVCENAHEVIEMADRFFASLP